MEKIIDEILEKEGGYVNDPSDRGGETNFGITRSTATHYGYTGEMVDLPEELAREIYKNIYILKPGFHNIHEMDEHIGEMVIDCGVNCGAYTAAKMFQRVINLFNKGGTWYDDLKVDGQIGSKSLNSFSVFLAKRGLGGRKVFADTYRCLRGYHYISLAERDQSQEDFIYGWMANRV